MTLAQCVDPVDVIIRRHRLEIFATNDGLIPSCQHRAAVRSNGIVGGGSAETADLALRRAVFEWFERYTQFAVDQSPAVSVGRYADLANAVDPRTFGLYSARQYKAQSFKCAPYNDDAPYEWVAVQHLPDGSSVFVPIEFIYPNARGNLYPLVRETSSGTAASMSADDALSNAICEAIERDALMRWWYRQEPAQVVPGKWITSDIVRDDLNALVERGFVVTIARLQAAAGLPCFVACAQRRSRSWIGSACALEETWALRHAVRELAQMIASCQDPDDLLGAPVGLELVKKAMDHYLIYQREPLASYVRAFFSATLRTDGIEFKRNQPSTMQCSLSDVYRLLTCAGFDAFAHRLMSPVEEDAPCVVRVLIRGLVPFHVGFGMERLGCRRLVERTNRGRFRTLLPHCLA